MARKLIASSAGKGVQFWRLMCILIFTVLIFITLTPKFAVASVEVCHMPEWCLDLVSSTCEQIGPCSVECHGQSNIEVPYHCWDFGDGDWECIDGPSSTITHTYENTCGPVAVRFIIGVNSTDCMNYSVVPLDCDTSPPDAHFVFFPNNPFLGRIITFVASMSHDNCGIANYYWDFGDGTGAEGIVVTHAYTKAGNYTVKLRVKDSSNNIDQTEAFIEFKGVKLHGNIRTTDPTGAVHNLEHIMVTLYWNGTEHTVYTDDNGYYVIDMSNDTFFEGSNGFLRVTLEDEGNGTVPYIKVYNNNIAYPIFADTVNFNLTSYDDLEKNVDLSNNPNISTGTLPISIADLDDAAIIYFHTYQAVDFALNTLALALDHSIPVEIFAWDGSGASYCGCPGCFPMSYIRIGVDYSDFWNGNRPDNREWHEFSHHIQADSLTGGDNNLPVRHANDTNHGGYPNHCTSDSWGEGFAEYDSCLIAVATVDPNRLCYSIGKDECAFYIEDNYKAWSWWGFWQPEEFAVAGLLWDLHDDVNFVENDWIDLTSVELWNLLNNANHDNVRDLYLTLDGLNWTALTGDNDADGIDNLDELFILHGFFSDIDVDYTYDAAYNGSDSFNSCNICYMHLGMVGGTSNVDVDTTSGRLWIADDPAAVDVTYPTGDWIFRARQATDNASDNFTAHIGVWSGAAFASIDSVSGTIAHTPTEFAINDVPSFTVDAGEWLALWVARTGGNGSFLIYTDNCSSWLRSPNPTTGQQTWYLRSDLAKDDFGEAVGFTGNATRPNREATPEIPGSYLIVNVLDNTTAKPVDVSEFEVEIVVDSPHDYLNRNFIIRKRADGTLYFTMPPPDYSAKAYIFSKKENYFDSEPLVIDTSFYFEKLSDSELEYLVNHTFYLIPGGLTLITPEIRTYSSTSVRLTFTVKPDNNTFNYSYCLDHGQNVPITGNRTINGLNSGNHTLEVYVYENNSTIASAVVHFAIHAADITGDKTVNVFDLQQLAWAFMSHPGDPNWNENADLNCDGVVNLFDLQILAWNFMNHY